MVPKTSAYVKRHGGETKWMYFFIEDDKLLETYNNIWKEIFSSMKKEHDCEPNWDKKNYGDEATDFYDKEVSRVGSSYPTLVVMVFDFVLKNGHNYYQQVFLKELKYIEKKKKGIRHITDELEIFSGDSDEK